MSRGGVLKWENIKIHYDNVHEDVSLDDEFKRDLLNEWLEDHDFEVQFIGMGDATADVFLKFEGEELASKVVAEFTSVTFEGLKEELFDEFINENVDDFQFTKKRKIKE